jgi:hypothetical protein
MSKISSGTKFGRLNFTLLFCICFSLLPHRVTAQPIDFSATTFKEPINIEFWKRHLRKGIEIDSSSRRYAYVIFHRPIYFTSTTFDSSVNFRAAQFHSTATFSGTNSKGAADFAWASFDSSVSFQGAIFHSTANFWRTNFKGTADFIWATFKGTTDFVRATFDSSVDFTLAEFHSTADFGRMVFKGSADFEWATFDSNVTFEYTDFYSTAVFGGTKFHGKADYRSARFHGDVLFSNDTLPDYLDFRYVKDIRKEIDFTSSLPPRPKEKCHIAVAGAEINKIKLNMALFTLWFPIDTTFGKSSAGKDSIERIDSTSYDGQLSVYESVLKKLKDDGFMESYQILDIEYRQFKFHHGPKLLGILNIGPLLNILNNVWWYYGYNKELIFLWAIGFWFLFSLVNLKVYPRLSGSVYTIPFLEKLETSLLTRVKKRLFYFFQVVTYTAIVFFGLKMDVAKFKKGVVREHPLLFVYLMFVYVVGLVCLGFIVNIIFTR